MDTIPGLILESDLVLDGTVSRIDPETTELAATSDVGLSPRWLAFGHGHVWVGVGGIPYDVPESPCN